VNECPHIDKGRASCAGCDYLCCHDCYAEHEMSCIALRRDTEVREFVEANPGIKAVLEDAAKFGSEIARDIVLWGSGYIQINRVRTGGIEIQRVDPTKVRIQG
jgi:hypothetical protein